MELSAEQKQQLEEQKQHCPFCKIIKGEIPSQQVYEDEHVLAILDINPARPGHTLVVPKEHYPVMAMLDEQVFAHLFEVLPQMTKRLREAMTAKHCSVFIANGAAAGQQSGHFMIHLIPSDKPLPNFNPAREQQDQGALSELEQVLEHNLPLMLRERSQQFPLEAEDSQADNPSQKQASDQRLAQLLEENPQFKQMLIEKPEAVLAGLEDNPSLKPLFEGVDVHALSQKLKEQELPSTGSEQPTPEQPAAGGAEPEPAPQEQIPRAVDLSDEQLAAYLEEHERLDHFLRNDVQTLKTAIQQQPRLARFFEQTSPEQVLARVQPAGDQSLEDLAGGSS